VFDKKRNGGGAYYQPFLLKKFYPTCFYSDNASISRVFIKVAHRRRCRWPRTGGLAALCLNPLC
jgi:hypothetical protein